MRAGSIVPIGPELQYTDEKPADPITLYVYAGADGAFTLYEDDGLTYGYEKGAFARIPLRWNDATKTLTIGKREGSFPGMLQSGRSRWCSSRRRSRSASRSRRRPTTACATTARPRACGSSSRGRAQWTGG